MGKVAQNSVKYMIEAKLESTGLVEKPDIVGAIFGQTEGLLGDELDLRELQERGRVGRIDVQVKEEEGRSTAEIKIPSSLNATETALLGASLETIERVGPTNADITVEEIRDERTTKRDYIVKRAKQLLKEMQDDTPEKGKITDEVKQEVRTTELTEYKGFQAGPEANSSEEIIIVEGRADLLNLLSNGVRNAIAVGGTSIPENIGLLPSEKKITPFLDGDRGGDLILKELEEKSDPDYVARAPENKEVEELGKEEIYKALRDKEQFRYAEEPENDEVSEEVLESLGGHVQDIIGTRAAYVLNSEIKVEEKMPLDKLGEADTESCKAVVIDGEVEESNVEEAEELEADFIVGMSRSGYANSSQLRILTKEEVKMPQKPE
ncbi:MAG: DNA primase [Nanohaloarchaea archaeon]|nr:DNA primase [Candidatus Nanohaloarchaea archaeon]